MLKYVSKFALDILPSVVGDHHRGLHRQSLHRHQARRRAGRRRGVDRRAEGRCQGRPKRPRPSDAKRAETSSDVANIPEPGVKAKGISEKAVLDRAGVEKSADKPAETASIPPDTRRHQAAPREKTVAKTVPAPQPSAPAVVPVVAAPSVAAAPNPAPPAEAAAPATPRKSTATPTIWRARRSSACVARATRSPRAQEAARAPDAARVPDAPRVVSAPPVRPLPPPIMVSTPASASRSIRRQDRRRESRLTMPRGSTIRAARRRRPIFRPRSRSICVPRRSNRCRGNAGTLPKTCCRRRNRCFTPCCRRHAVGGEIGVPRGIVSEKPLAEIFSRTVRRLWPGLPPTRAKPLRAASSLGRRLMARPYEPAALVLSPRRS